MDVNKWKSIAVDIESYTIIRAMGENGLRNPGNMIKKMVSDSVKKIAKKEGVAEGKMKENFTARKETLEVSNKHDVEERAGRLALFFYLQSKSNNLLI